MQRRLIALSLLVLQTLSTHAADQAPKPLLSLDELRVPVFPAFTLLGVTPTEIERPSTARAFAVGLLSASERSSGDLPTNLALEVAPYWWSDQPKLTFDGYYNARIGQRIAQSLAVSLATSELATYLQDEDANGTAVSLGVRAMILGGKRNPELVPAVEALKAQLSAFNISDCVPSSDLATTAPTAGEEIRRESEIELSPACEQQLQLIRERAARVTAFDRERVGLVLEAAAGAVTEIPDDDASDRRTSKYGAWLTWSYRGTGNGTLNDANSWTVVALQRWLRDDVVDSDAFDVGARLIYKSKANQWSASYEYLQRFADEDADSSSSRFTLEYVLNERYTLTAALGRGFRNDESKSPLVAIAGLAVGWGGAKMQTH
jgi:hypothetical protein